MNATFDARGVAAGLLARLGHPPPSSVLPLPGGRNNRVWKVESDGGLFLLKCYFWSEQDPRDRLGQEWGFLCYLRDIGCRRAPAPLVQEPGVRCALLEFVDGAPACPDVSLADVREAAEFFREINCSKNCAAHLPPVSEACFSLAAHLVTTARRVERLSEISDPEVRDFVETTLRPLWRKTEENVRSRAGRLLNDELPASARCLSPSDFGFHNALRQVDGSLRFLDFEYAGWDDPAKTIVDFCNQPDGLLSSDLAAEFMQSAMRVCAGDPSLAQRVSLLEPVYQLKWACICLNNFLPGRSFESGNPARSPAAQLLRARTMVARAGG